MIRTEGYFLSKDEKELYYQTWQKEDAKANIIVSHGLAEHSEAYQRLASALLDKLPVNVFAWDLRGHGKSYGKRGVVRSFNEYTKDLYAFYLYLCDKSQNPFIFLGHSMGGLITVKTLIDYQKQFQAKALVLSSPLMGIEMEVPKFKKESAKYLAKYLPRFTMNNQIDFKSLTHDQNIIQEYEKDPLRHDRICPRLYLDFMETFPKVMKKAGQVKCPTLLQVAGDDHLVSKKSSLEFFNRLGSDEKEKIEYDGFYHEIYNEVERETVYKDLVHFLEKQID